MCRPSETAKLNRYGRIVEVAFLERYRPGSTEVLVDRTQLALAAAQLGIALPKNLGDIIYSFRYRTPLPKSIRDLAPRGKQWIIRASGPGKYRFVATDPTPIAPTIGRAETKIPDATPGIIDMYAKSDEQALLAKLRYNRLVDIVTGVTCYSLQSHLRTTVQGMGQVETDEVYIGVDRRGVHYVFPVQAKGGNDALNVVQIEQDFALCRDYFASLVCRPIAAQFVGSNLIALFDFEQVADQVRIVSESHYRLVPPEDVKPPDLMQYRSRPLS